MFLPFIFCDDLILNHAVFEQVLQRNYYYSDRQKRKIVTDIAKTVNDMMVIAENEKNKPRPVAPPVIVEEEASNAKSAKGSKKRSK